MKEGELGARKRMIGNREISYFVIIGPAGRAWGGLVFLVFYWEAVKSAD